MAPLVPIFAAEDLPSRVQIVHRGFKEKRRKGEPIDLHKCELMELVQYSCNPPEEGILAPGVVKCKPIVRLFRRCADGLTVETTSWEKMNTNNKVDTSSNTAEIQKGDKA
ncbi:hypothetical protein TMatcc_010262 [Talaromyces marneffei ATCC 18224]|uniref:Mitochondrial export protein Som1 n=2 Tax=Talaromyces marneffei TaxID=37727 RepID=B6QW23_TALMQ|nr:uncharacterized protein EYB26_009937 [Talaromyces marneffei]EEA19190.1 conserved hypothetical protein [Talaromyces marneffei ATCC 18224]KAE8548879.1 hypothetical protein EYB25_009262 [Talaromyces marneffei]QGA22221.1 hypothetical protein EYB26_009937 [Talaromyces marneffei]